MPFYPDLVPASWFDETALPAGWFDESTLTPPSSGGGSASVELDLTQFAQPPYLQLALAKTVTVGWTGADTMTVSFVGEDGAVTVLGTTPGTYDVPRGQQTGYAGSWAQDHGAGVVTDTGTDVDPVAGLSDELMGTPEGVHHYGLGQGRTYGKLRFEFTASGPVTIDWPEFGLDTSLPTAFVENRNAQVILHADGPMVRWGQHQWYDRNTSSFQDPPLVGLLGAERTIIDAIAFKYRALLGSGGAALSTTIATDLTGLFDTFEGQAIGQVDPGSMAFLLPFTTAGTWRFALINSLSESPPLSCFPFRKRNANWLPTGEHANVAILWSEDTRHLVSSPGVGVMITRPDGTPEGGPRTSGVPAGYQVWDLAPELDNTETGWLVRKGGRNYGEVRPWHGFSWLSPLEQSQLLAFAISRRAGRQSLVLAGEEEARLVSHRNNAPRPAGINPNEAADLSGYVAGELCYDPLDNLVFYGVTSSDELQERVQKAEYRAWSAPVTIATGAKFVGGDIDKQTGVRYTYFVTASGQIKGLIRDALGAVVEPEFLVTTGAAQAAPEFEIGPPLAGGNWLGVLWYIRASDSTLQELTTPNGKDFS